ncbi:MAG: hypothetical protein P1U81_02190 [Verrucomicrobiales bacterium]|nr:hypothetical protein [Verrucomicrobiales bacterium]
MIPFLRAASLLFALAFLLLGLVWTYWIALLGWLAGALAWAALARARRLERSAEIERTTGRARFDAMVLWLLALSALASVVSLVAVLIRN